MIHQRLTPFMVHYCRTMNKECSTEHVQENKSVSLTGQGGINPGHVADSMMDAVIDFLRQTPQSSLKTVRIVIFQAPMLVDFHQSMLRREATKMQKNESTWSRITCTSSWFLFPPRFTWMQVVYCTFKLLALNYEQELLKVHSVVMKDVLN